MTPDQLKEYLEGDPVPMLGEVEERMDEDDNSGDMDEEDLTEEELAELYERELEPTRNYIYDYGHI